MTIEEIDKFVNQPRRKDQYMRVLNHMETLLRQYHYHIPEGRRVIYRVATREDYQQGDKFKRVQRIQEKINKKREEQKKRGKEPSYSIHDVGDIIGVRVVCVYPSDVDVVSNFIRSEHKKNLEIVPREDKEIRKKSGYREHRFVVRHVNPTLSVIKCEIQIVTMLSEAWSFKEHRLIYGKANKIKETYVKQSRLLSDGLAVLDGQSELLAQEVEEEMKE